MPPAEFVKSEQFAQYLKRCEQRLPGDLYGMPLPKTPEELASKGFGAAWLTRALHKAGTLPEGNRVARASFRRFNERTGGSGPKMLIDVEYETPDDSLDGRLFVKMPFTNQENAEQHIMQDAELKVPDTWAGEIQFYIYVSPHVPFSVPRFYFGDMSRESLDAILITSAVPFPDGRNDTDFRPYEVLPTTDKVQDYLYKDVHELYMALARKQGTLAGLDKVGGLGPYTANCYHTRGAQPCLHWATWFHGAPFTGYEAASQALPNGRMIGHFIRNVAPHIFPEELRSDEGFIRKLERQVSAISEHRANVQRFVQSDPRFTAMMNMNANSDNAYFWRLPDGTLDAGLLDFASTGTIPFPVAFHGMFCSALGDMVSNHEDAILRAFLDSYHATGAPPLPFEEFQFRYRVSAANSVAYTVGKVDTWMPPEKAAAWSLMASYDDPALKANFSFNDRFMTSQAYNAVILWWRRGDVYYEAFLRWLREHVAISVLGNAAHDLW